MTCAASWKMCLLACACVLSSILGSWDEVSTPLFVLDSTSHKCASTNTIVRYTLIWVPPQDEVRPSTKCAPTSNSWCTLSQMRPSQAIGVPSSTSVPSHKQNTQNSSYHAQASMVCPQPCSSSTMVHPSSPKFSFSSLHTFTQLSQVNNEPPFPSFASFSLISRLTYKTKGQD